MGRYYDVEVVRVDELTPHHRSIFVKRADGDDFSIRAGQFLMMHFEHDGKKLNRSYSVSNPVPVDGPVEELELCVALVEGGIGSQIVAGWEPGDTFTASGPHGRFILRPGEDVDLVLVGTGTGIAPYRSMIPSLELALDAGRQIDLVFGARSRDQFLYDAEWKELAAAHTNFNYWRCASRDPDPAAWEDGGGIVGRVQHALDRIETSEDAIFYLCGNPAMVEEVTERLQADGRDRRSIRTEAYTSPPPR